MKTKLVAFCALGSYHVSVEACFMDLGGLEEHTYLTVLMENSKKHYMTWCASLSILTCKASPLGPVFKLAAIVPSQC